MLKFLFKEFFMTRFCSSCGKDNKNNAKFCSYCGEEFSHITSTGTLASSVVLDKRYEILELVNAGGMGGIYLAKDTRLDELCAVKEMFLHSLSPKINPM